MQTEWKETLDGLENQDAVWFKRMKLELEQELSIFHWSMFLTLKKSPIEHNIELLLRISITFQKLIHIPQVPLVGQNILEPISNFTTFKKHVKLNFEVLVSCNKM